MQPPREWPRTTTGRPGPPSSSRGIEGRRVVRRPPRRWGGRGSIRSRGGPGASVGSGPPGASGPTTAAKSAWVRPQPWRTRTSGVAGPPDLAEECPTGERLQHRGEATGRARRPGPIPPGVTPHRYVPSRGRRPEHRAPAGPHRAPARGRHLGGRPPLRPGRGRVGQDDRPHPAGGPPPLRRVGRGRAHPGGDLHPQGLPGAPGPALALSTSPGRSGPAPSTPPPTPSSAGTGPTPAARPPPWSTIPAACCGVSSPPPEDPRPPTPCRRRPGRDPVGPGPPARARDLRRGGAGPAGRRTPLPVDEMAEIYARYVEAKRTHGVIDLNDLLIRCADLLETDTAVAAAARWRIRHLFVDEFQDVNPAQWRLLAAWLGDRPDLFVVGDPRQAVYGWNGADPTLLDRLPDLLPGTTVLRLDANHRSTPQVIAAAGAVLAGPTAPVTPCTDAPSAAGTDGRPDGPVPAVRGFDDDDEEAAAVARWLRVMHRPGRPWSHLAVLARTNARLGTRRRRPRSGRHPLPHRARPGCGAEIRAVIDPAGHAPGAASAQRPGRSRPWSDRPDGTTGPADAGDGDSGSGPAAFRRRWPGWPTSTPSRIPAPPSGGFLAWLAATVDDGDVGVGGRSRRRAPWSCPPSTGPRASSGRPSPSSASRTAWSRSPTPPRRRPEPRSGACSTSPSPAPRSTSGVPGRASARRPGGTWSCRPSPLLDAIEAAGRAPGTERPRTVRRPDRLLRARLPATASPPPGDDGGSPSGDRSPWRQGATSTKTGAWSDGCFPLRAFRSTRA